MKKVTTHGLMVTTFILLASVLALVAFGQSPERGEHKMKSPEQKEWHARGAGPSSLSGEELIEKLKNKVDISNQEAEQIKSVYNETQVTLDEINEELRSVMKKRNDTITEILGPEKSRKALSILFQTWRSGRGTERPFSSGRQGQVAMKIRGRIADDLGLTDEQKSKIKEIEDARGQAIKDINVNAQEDIKTLLTPEQLETYNQFHERLQRGKDRMIEHVEKHREGEEKVQKKAKGESKEKKSKKKQQEEE